MYIDKVPNRGSPPAVLIREGWRENGKVRKRTVANISDWPDRQVEDLRQVLKGRPMVPADEALKVETSLPHGHVRAVLLMIRRLGLDRTIAGRRCRERDLVLAMLVDRILHGSSKLAATRAWHNTTLAGELEVADADENDLHAAMDWLLKRQEGIEKRLAARHLRDGDQVLYDVSSSYVEGDACPPAEFGHNRDGKRNKRIVVYGALADREGRPLAIRVYPGNTGDPTTVPDQIAKIRGGFGLKRAVLVGDRGLLTRSRIEALREDPGMGWVTALRGTDIRRLATEGTVQPSLFDHRDMAEIRSDLFPGERLVACFNPLLAGERRRKRDELLAATEERLEGIRNDVPRRTRTPLSAGEIGKRVGKVINRHKMGKHFETVCGDGSLEFRRRDGEIAREAALDGIHVIRTGEAELDAEEAVRSYKNLARLEWVFRTMKGLNPRVRPMIHRRGADRVRAHILLCMLACHVEWHLRRAWTALLFDDDGPPESRDAGSPVAPRSAPAPRDKRAHSFATLLGALSTQCRNKCRAGPVTKGREPITFEMITRPTPLQEKAFALLKAFPVTGR